MYSSNWVRIVTSRLPLGVCTFIFFSLRHANWSAHILDELKEISIFLFNFMCLWWFNLMFCLIKFLMVVGGPEASRLDTTSVVRSSYPNTSHFKQPLPHELATHSPVLLLLTRLDLGNPILGNIIEPNITILKYMWGLSKTKNIFQTNCHINISLYKYIPYFSLVCKYLSEFMRREILRLQYFYNKLWMVRHIISLMRIQKD